MNNILTFPENDWAKEKSDKQKSCEHVYGYDDFSCYTVIVRNPMQAGMISKEIDDEHNYKYCPNCGIDLSGLILENRKRLE